MKSFRNRAEPKDRVPDAQVREGRRNGLYLRSQAGTMHLASIICAIVVLICHINHNSLASIHHDHKHHATGTTYAFVYFTAVFSLVFSVVSLFLFSAGIVKAEALQNVPWEMVVGVLAVGVAICFIASGAIGVEHCTRFYTMLCTDRCQVHPAIASFCFLGGIVNLLLAGAVYRGEN